MRFLLVDDHSLFRWGLRLILEEALPSLEIQEAGTVEDMYKLLPTGTWSLLCLDVTMPGSSGLEALKQVKRMHPELPVLVLSMHGEAQYATRALRAGASGYISKDNPPQELLRAVHRVLSGRTYITESQAVALVKEVSHGGRSDRALSDREFEVLRGLARGLSVTEIATNLGLSVKTISTYRTRMLEKLGLSTNAELIEFARASGML